MTYNFQTQVQSRLNRFVGTLPSMTRHTWLVAAMFLLLTTFSFAQGSTSALGGKVFDAQNHVIQNALVTVTSDDTGVHWTARTNEAGDWHVDALIAGHYHFDVVASGFQKAQYPTFALEMADQKFIDVVLQVGSATSSITVVAAEPLIDTTAAVSGTILEDKDIQELPSLSNTATEYGLLTPGVVYSGISSTMDLSLWSNVADSGFTTNGSGSGTNAMNYVMDGATDVIPSSGGIAFIPPMDAVQEVRMTTNAYDASIERTAAGTVNMMLKAGGKNFHGDIYEINKNNFANANYYGYGALGKSTPVVRQNEYGGTVGGPVWIPKLYNGRNKGTFFFFNYDGIRAVTPYATGTMSLPTAQERAGDFSASYVTQTINGVTTKYTRQLFDPATAADNGGIRTPIASENISGRITPMAKALMALTPLPNKASDGASTDSNDFLINDPQSDKFYGFSIRADQAWNNNHHSYLEYRYNNFWQFAGNPFGPSNILEGAYLIRLNHGLTANHAWVISPKLLLNVTGNATIYRTPNHAPSIGLDPAKYGFSSELAAQQVAKGLPALNGVFGSSSAAFSNIGGTTDSWEYDYDWEGKGYLQQTWGNHMFHYGAEWLVQQEANGSHNSGSGNYTFTGIWTVQNPAASSTPLGYGSNVADFLLGMPASGNEDNDASGYYSQPFMGFYVQDDWRVTPKLTLNLGIRWDYQLAMTERHDKYWSRYDPDYNLTTITDYIQPKYAALLGGSASGSTGVSLVQAYGPAVNDFIAKGAILYAGVNGTSRSITDPQPNYWQPRLGFAYQIRPTTVIRGGAGRFAQATYVANHANQTGYSSSTTFDATNDNYVTQASTLDNPFPNGFVAQTGNSLGVYTNPGSVTSFDTHDLKRQYTDDVSLHLQQEFKDYLIEIGGVFEHTVGLVVGYQVDNPTPTQFNAAFGPVFDSTGAPAVTLPGDVQVTNPFKGAPYMTNSRSTANTIEAYWLLFPNPIINGITEYVDTGRSDHYAFQAKVNRHLRNGFMLNYAFSWGKQMDSTGYVTNSIFSQKILRQLSGNDVRFQNVVSTSYVLPFGRGKLFLSKSGHLLDSAIGGWELSGMYVMYSGTPIGLPTDSSFFEGGDPGLGSKKSLTHWFNTSKFYPFPSESTTVAQLATYPSWTGVMSLPGAGWTPTSSSDARKNGVFNDFHAWSTNYPTQYGDVRNPYFQTFNLGLRKSFAVWHETNLQLRLDVFNALNHPIFGNFNTSPGTEYFGYANGSNTLSQVNLPRTIQLEGKFYF